MIDHEIRFEDASALARLHQQAFPGFFLSGLGEPFLVQFYLGFVDEPTAIVVVHRDATGRPQGVGVGTTDPVGFFGRLLRRRLLGFAVASARATLANPRVAPRLLKAVSFRGDTPSDRDGALFSSLCVLPGLSGRGIGSALMNAWVHRAKEMGAETAFLVTDAHGNDAVNRLYAREGWVLSEMFVTGERRVMNRYEFNLLSLDAG